MPTRLPLLTAPVTSFPVRKFSGSHSVPSCNLSSTPISRRKRYRKNRGSSKRDRYADAYSDKQTKRRSNRFTDSSDEDRRHKPTHHLTRFSDDPPRRKPASTKPSRFSDYSDDERAHRRSLKRAPTKRSSRHFDSSSSDGIYYKPPPNQPPDPPLPVKKSFQLGRSRPKRDQYEVPRWEFSDELFEKFDVKPAFHKLQREFALSVLRDSI